MTSTAADSRWDELLQRVEAKRHTRERETCEQKRSNVQGAVHQSEGWVGLEAAMKELQRYASPAGATSPAAPAPHLHPALAKAGITAAQLESRPVGPFGATGPAAGDSGAAAVAPEGAAGEALSAACALRILGTMAECAGHENRFVREGAYGVIEAVLDRLGSGNAAATEDGALLACLCGGLQDNWSQVRYRATHAIKAFVKHGHLRDADHTVVLPRLCLNRYYIAEGVRVVTQRLWQDVVGDSGIALVRRHAEAFVAYYAAQLAEKNHAVREAACHCIAELAAKVPGMADQAPRLLAIVDGACDDPSWPVRDVACVSAARILARYPTAVDAAAHERAYARFLYQAEDPIPSVRQHAAEALATYAGVSEAACARVHADLQRFLGMIHTQPETRGVSTDLQNTTEFGVAQRKYANDAAAHTGKPMFGCGSLSPGPSTARVLGGCSGGHAVPRTGLDPWFATDTAVHALRFLADAAAPGDDAAGERILALLRLVPDTLAVKCFVQYPQYWQSVWQCFAATVRGVGKRRASSLVGEMVPALFEALQCAGSQLTAAAAADCVAELRRTYGETVWEGKLDAQQLELAATHPLIKLQKPL